ncbi:hypothetical protein [Agrococcus sp. DT81.2]|uniref:hypothetical protein n=1 Tax=Agrococcus sp. DT81.2 TaxID=3393414 RepID=UPI003CE5BE0A
MFGKKRRQAPRVTDGPSGTPLGSPLAFNIFSLHGGSIPNQQGVFKVEQTSTFHPLNVYWWMNYYGATAEVWIGTPYRSEGVEKFRLVDLPHGEWTPLRTRSGRTIPAEIYVDDVGVFARWTT